MIHHGAILADVVFLNAIDFRSVDVNIVPVADDGARIGSLEIDANLGILADENFPGFGGRIFHNGCVFDVVRNGGSEGFKVFAAWSIMERA